MNILYVSTLCSKTKFNDLFNKSVVKPAQQAQKYHRLMVEGLAQNEGISVKALTAAPVSRAISNEWYHKREFENINNIEYEYLSFINMPLLRQIGLFITGFIGTLKWCRKHPEGAVVCDVLNISVSSAALFASKLNRTRSVGIVTDVPDYLSKMSGDKINLSSRLISWINTYIMNRFDSYIFLTKQMNQLINLTDKPYVIIEGQVDINMAKAANIISDKHEAKICLYAGTLNKIYGLKLLTDAFSAADIADAELHIYGSGDFVEELKKICIEHTNIKYFGVVPNDAVVVEQLKATLLINPRPTNKEYTKYSFPSKNMEYMVSGTPVLTTRLPGMPKEYEPYVYLIEKESANGIANILTDVLSLSREDLHKKGTEAKKFVLENKNNVVQAAKVIKMIKMIKEKDGLNDR